MNLFHYIHIYRYYLLYNHQYIPFFLLLIYFYFQGNFHLLYNGVPEIHQNNNNNKYNFYSNLYKLNNNYQYIVNIDDYNYLRYLYILYKLNNKVYIYNYQIYILTVYN